MTAPQSDTTRSDVDVKALAEVKQTVRLIAIGVVALVLGACALGLSAGFLVGLVTTR